MRVTRECLLMAMLVGLSCFAGSAVMSAPPDSEEAVLSKLVVSYEDQGVFTSDGQRKIVVHCNNQSDYHISAVLDIDFFDADGRQMTTFWDDQRITDLEPHETSWGILWLRSISPIASSSYHFSNVSFEKIEMPSGGQTIISIPELAKMSQEQLAGLLGVPETYTDVDPDYVTLVFQINRSEVTSVEVSFDGSELVQFIVHYDPPIDGYRLALEKLGLTSSLPPDVTAPAVYRWEENTRLDGFFSVQVLRQSGGKVDGVSVVLNPY